MTMSQFTLGMLVLSILHPWQFHIFLLTHGIKHNSHHYVTEKVYKAQNVYAFQCNWINPHCSPCSLDPRRDKGFQLTHDVFWSGIMKTCKDSFWVLRGLTGALEVFMSKPQLVVHRRNSFLSILNKVRLISPRDITEPPLCVV